MLVGLTKRMTTSLLRWTLFGLSFADLTCWRLFGTDYVMLRRINVSMHKPSAGDRRTLFESSLHNYGVASCCFLVDTDFRSKDYIEELVE